MKNKDIIIIILLIILLLAVGGFVVYINISNNQKLEEMNKVPSKIEQSGVEKVEEKKEVESTEISNLKKQLEEKEKEIESLKKKTNTSLSTNKYVPLKKENITPKKDWQVENTVYIPCAVGEREDNEVPQIWITMTSEGKLEVGGDIYPVYSERHDVKNITKKVVAIETASGGQDLTTFCFAIMEDGTLEQIIMRDGEFKSLGTISGVSNVVRVESLTYGYGNYPVVVQGDGKAIMLDSKTNKNFTWDLGYWES